MLNYDKLIEIVGDNVHKSIVYSSKDMLINRLSMIEKEQKRIEYIVENFYHGIFDKFMSDYIIKINAEKALINLRLG